MLFNNQDWKLSVTDINLYENTVSLDGQSYPLSLAIKALIPGYLSGLPSTSRQVSDQHQKKPFFIIMSYLIYIIFLKNLFVNRTKCSISETINHESGHTRHQQGLHILQARMFPLFLSHRSPSPRKSSC